jgi:CheY-like chemotaxis protein
MDPATQARIFEPFFTTKFTGRGLGLSAVLGIVGSYGGALSVESQAHQGTRFRVLLPVTEKPTERREPEGGSDARGSGTILVIDDEPLVLSAAHTALERAGYPVQPANGGAEAEKILKGQRQDICLAILDMTMPDRTAVETLRRLRSIRPDLPVILSTGYSEAEAAKHFAGTDFAGFLQRPYTATQVAEKVKQAMPPGVKAC